MPFVIDDIKTETNQLMRDIISRQNRPLPPDINDTLLQKVSSIYYQVTTLEALQFALRFLQEHVPPQGDDLIHRLTQQQGKIDTSRRYLRGELTRVLLLSGDGGESDPQEAEQEQRATKCFLEEIAFIAELLVQTKNTVYSGNSTPPPSRQISEEKKEEAATPPPAQADVPPPPIPCQQCTKVFENETFWKAHVDAAHGDRGGDNVCCAKQASTLYTLPVRQEKTTLPEKVHTEDALLHALTLRYYGEESVVAFLLGSKKKTDEVAGKYNGSLILKNVPLAALTPKGDAPKPTAQSCALCGEVRLPSLEDHLRAAHPTVPHIVLATSEGNFPDKELAKAFLIKGALQQYFPRDYEALHAAPTTAVADTIPARFIPGEVSVLTAYEQCLRNECGGGAVSWKATREGDLYAVEVVAAKDGQSREHCEIHQSLLTAADNAFRRHPHMTDEGRQQLTTILGDFKESCVPPTVNNSSQLLYYLAASLFGTDQPMKEGQTLETIFKQATLGQWQADVFLPRTSNTEGTVAVMIGSCMQQRKGDAKDGAVAIAIKAHFGPFLSERVESLEEQRKTLSQSKQLNRCEQCIKLMRDALH
ncbi:hypothetical protein AGDE_15892 [Angomonas deanei]|nr:hypothetical protein AGDE_15892 [Angomonas deanei]|eukprot:EPY18194.1 hypothetical protein AGDE_15892 [Angomonas deanei]